jgi:lysozyme
MINAATIALVKEFEGLRLNAYQDAVGVWTIGYGTTGMAGVGISPLAGMKISETDAEMYLRRGLEKFAADIRPAITAPINDNEFGAFLSLAYNIGPGAFRRSSALRKFNAGDKAGAANAILLWNKAGGKVLRGLVRRREAERALFLTRPAPHVNETPKSEHNPRLREAVDQLDAKPANGWGALIFAAIAALVALLRGRK